jgi:hypothetical protein
LRPFAEGSNRGDLLVFGENVGHWVILSLWNKCTYINNLSQAQFVRTLKNMGRKKLPEDKVKNVFLPKIRVSEEEKAEFEQKARLSGLSFSEWVRKLLKSAVD